MKVSYWIIAAICFFVLALALLVLSSVFLGYKAMQREGPAIPFDELPRAVQHEFEKNIDRGMRSTEIQDWDGASRYFMAAYDLHPRNPEAEEGLEQLAMHLVSIAPNMETARQKEYLLKLIRSYTTNEYLSNHEKLSAVRANLEQAAAQ